MERYVRKCEEKRQIFVSNKGKLKAEFDIPEVEEEEAMKHPGRNQVLPDINITKNIWDARKQSQIEKRKVKSIDTEQNNELSPRVNMRYNPKQLKLPSITEERWENTSRSYSGMGAVD